MENIFRQVQIDYSYEYKKNYKVNNSSLPYRRSNLRKIFGSFIWRWQILSTPVKQNVPLCHKQSFEMSGVNFRNYILVANPDLIALL